MPNKIGLLFLSIVLVGCQTIPPAPHSSDNWQQLDGWQQDNHAMALTTFIRSCAKKQKQPHWQQLCLAAQQAATNPAPLAAKHFFEQHFVPQCSTSQQALITGYYQPLLRGARQYSPRYPHPIYAVPDDLLKIQLPMLEQKRRLRGRLGGNNTVLPYWTRAQIDTTPSPLIGQELLWVADAIDLFFLHVQGSGLVALDDGEIIAVNYADDNGHAYQSIGRVMVAENILSLKEVDLFSIQRWLRANPNKVSDIFNQNPRYIFFRTAPYNRQGPIGAQGVELTPQRSLAVDVNFIELGSPVWVSSTMPDDATVPLQRLMIAQDTGSAIIGKNRADFFWGRGAMAKKRAGLMKHKGQLCPLYPRHSVR